MLNSINKKFWNPYIKTYEDFNKKIPDELKMIFSIIRKMIGNPTESFKITIDLNELDFCDIILHIDVDFKKSISNKMYHEKDIIYYSNININDLLLLKHDIDMPIKIEDVDININKLISVISHEIRHIYDVYTINEEYDMNSFVKSLYYGNLQKLENDKIFKHFLFLIYLSLEHELIARNTMIWEMFMENHCSKEKLYNLFENSNLYNSFIQLNDFDYTKTIKIKDVIDKINNFINFFGGEIYENDNDVEKFFRNWKNYFKLKSKEFLKEGYLILDDLYDLNKIKLNENVDIIKNVKGILLDIHKKFIFNK